MSSGSVYDDCKCSPGELMNLTLPSYCYSPTGSDCDWYEDCLEKQYSCENTEAADAIKFSKIFCDLYTDHFDKFSSIGESWVDHARRCMQVQLAPILHPANQQTCQSLKEMALKSYFPSCYLKPSENNSISFCNLPMKDRWTVFWTVKGAMVDGKSTSIKWLFAIIAYCNTSHDQNHLRKFAFTFERHHLSRRKRTPAQFNWTTQHETEIGNTLANSRMWKEKGVVWYAVAVQSQKNNDTNYEIGMVIAEQKMLI
ncbi:hypothetical protein FSP39_013140 [Pinctada imbricata]|uniref:Uncharacterized protein n=1 Tax=Pinctada imbricata TaxID=66713 RepID=A0AA88Y0C6_PINIB|nr:hypothetical protein FSP39_013140 [Pinctada imbricata]